MVEKVLQYYCNIFLQYFTICSCQINFACCCYVQLFCKFWFEYGLHDNVVNQNLNNKHVVLISLFFVQFFSRDQTRNEIIFCVIKQHPQDQKCILY